MFGTNTIYQKPLVQQMLVESSFPSAFKEARSKWFWKSMEYDGIEEIVAVRFYPVDNAIAIKLMYRDDTTYTSIYIYNPELRVLKRLYECGNAKINAGIRFYLANSEDADGQYRNGRTLNNIDSIVWFKKVISEN